MTKSNPIREKSYVFSLKVIATCSRLNQRREYVFAKQLFKSGTSIGANVEEALQGQSRKDFIAKLSISLKEAQETHYWLRLLRDSHTLGTEETDPLLADVTELLRLLTAIVRTTKST